MKRQYGQLGFLAGTFLVLIILQRLFAYLNETTFFRFQKNTILSIQKDLLNRVFQYPLEFFDKKHSGYLIGRIRGDVAGLSYIFSEGFVRMAMDILRFIAGCVILLTLNIKLTLISLGVVPFLLFKIIYSKSEIKKINERILEENARLEKELSDTFQGMEVLKSFSREEKGIERTVKALSDFQQIEVKRNSIFSKYRNLVDLIVHFGEVLLLYFGIREVIKGNLSIGSYIAFGGYLLYLYSPIKNFSYLNIYLDYARRSYKRIEELMSILPEDSGDKEISEIQSIDVRNLFFSYDGAKEVIKDLSFSIKRGERLLIKGKSGSGKSTFVKLLLGLYKPMEGKIFYNGVDLEKINKKSLRERIGYVSQNIFLFNKTLKENILLGERCLSDGELEDLLEDCKLKDRLDNKGFFQNGKLLDIEISERGLNLSGGERQLVALLRAIVKKPDMVILDEAVSNLDVETEREIERIVFERFKEAIIVKISHRESEEMGWRVIRLERINRKVAQSSSPEY